MTKLANPLSRAPLFRAIAPAAAIAALAMVASQPALAEEHSDAEATEMTEGEERLAKMLEGRVAGEPRRCIRNTLNQPVTIIDETAIVYGRGNTIYVQRTKNPESIDDRDALVSRRFNASQVCRLDIVNTIDPFNGFFTGAVFFDDFIPYTRVDEDEG
ncbi:hypothetical protein NAP1_14423 [Erythrobacter sp. NAP1]|uniref:hypothetical protein n=1 Tax=Erythrobacter sp. NAP1 TaxID=237727 RepID=UPI00006875A2|nr:hypothetical protein [Erythrobacter sp. NAP1]EAQ28802.1 hypothetical protein NAP1_14423 [Erythrobacter sp. NAP1]